VRDGRLAACCPVTPVGLPEPAIEPGAGPSCYKRGSDVA
jgi:hypothetical protein